MNFKKILLGTTIAAASFGLFACGDDSSSGTDPATPDTPVGPEIDIPTQSTLSPVIFDNIKITPMSGVTSMRGALSGILKLDPEFVNTEVPYTVNAETMIDSVKFLVGKTVNGKAYQEPITIDLQGITFPTERVSFSQKYIEYSSLSSCGEFTLYIFAYSSTKEADLNTSIYTSVLDTLKFTRPEQECQTTPIVESSSSAAEVCTPVTAVATELSNSMGTSLQAINFETGTAENPHVSIKFANNMATLEPTAGVTIHEDNVQTTGLLPTGNVCLEKFVPGPTYSEELTSGLWLDVVTADGKVYPLMINKAMFESATKGTVSLTYFK